MENIVIALIALSILFIPAMAFKAVVDDTKSDKR